MAAVDHVDLPLAVNVVGKQRVAAGDVRLDGGGTPAVVAVAAAAAAGLPGVNLPDQRRVFNDDAGGVRTGGLDGVVADDAGHGWVPFVGQALARVRAMP